MFFKSAVSTALLFGSLKLVSASNSAGYSFTNALQDCVNLLENFDYTLNQIHEDNGDYVRAYPYKYDNDYRYYELVSCSYPGMCPDADVKQTCTW